MASTSQQSEAYKMTTSTTVSEECTWNCVSCTLENSFTVTKCTVCETPIPSNVSRPSEAPKPDYGRVASADLQFLNLLDSPPAPPPVPPAPAWRNNSVMLPGMGDQRGMDSFQGLRPVGSSAPLNLPVSNAVPAPKSASLGNSGVALLFNGLGGSPSNAPGSPSSNAASSSSSKPRTGLDAFSMHDTTQTHSDGSGTKNILRHLLSSSTDVDQLNLTEDDLISFKSFRSFQSCGSVDESDIYEARRSSTFTTFSNFGGNGAVNDTFFDAEPTPTSARANAAAGQGFPTSDMEEGGQQPVKVSAKERWHRVRTKLKAASAFGGFGTIGGDIHGSYDIPADMEAKRLIARAEMLSSEKEYYSRLCVLCDCFMTPLIGFIDNTLARAAFSRGGSGGGSFNSSASFSSNPSSSTRRESAGGIVGPGGITVNTADEVRKIFGNILQIRELTKHFLEELEPVATDPKFKIGPVFIKLAPFLRIYLVYYQSFEAARLALDKLRSAFWCDSFLSACEAQPACHGRGIKDFLIEPVQRVPRYEMLIKEVIKYTPSGHPNNPALLEALKEVKTVADGMNLDMGCSDSRFMVASLSIAWVGVDFTAPHRLFLKEGCLIKTDRHGMKRKNSFLLFNDLMCYGDRIDESTFFGFNRKSEEKGGSERYKLRFKAPLVQCLVIDDTMVYGQHGALKLRDDTPYANAMMATAAKKKGDVGRLARAMDQLNGGGSGQSEAAQAWDLLESCGASMERIMESQLDEKSFLIQVQDKTLYLTAASVKERKEWVTAFADAIKNCLEAEKKYRNGQRRLSAIATKMESGHRQVVANESLISRLTKGRARKNSNSSIKESNSVKES